MSEFPPPRRRRRGAAAAPGHALFGALASSIRLLQVLLLGLVGLYLCSGITRVAPHEDALIYRFGQLQREVHPPGLLFALPAPIDRVVKVPTRTHNELFLIDWSPDEDAVVLGSAGAGAPAVEAAETRIHPALAAVLPGSSPLPASPAVGPVARNLHPVFDGYTLTGDANLVQARFTVRYRIVDPLAHLGAAATETVEPLLTAAVHAAAAQALAGMAIDAALGTGLESFHRTTNVLAQRRIDALGLGVELVAFEVNTLTPPAAVVGAFADVTSAQVEARTMLEKARAERAHALPQVASEAFRLQQAAAAEAQQVVARATGEASSFGRLLAEYRAQPALVDARLRAETLQQVLPRVQSQVVLPSGSALNVYIKESK